MTIGLLDDATIALERICPAEDAEYLPQHATVDWRECDETRDGVAKVLTISVAKLTVPPRNIYLTMFAAPQIDDRQASRRSRSGA